MKQIIIISILFIISISTYSQNYYLGIESGYGISSSRIDYPWTGSSQEPLADNCGKVGITGKIIFKNKIGISTSLNYLFIQSPEKLEFFNIDDFGPIYFTNKLHYLNLPICLSYSIKYFRIETGMYYSFLLAQQTEIPVKKSDLGILFKLNFDLYKGLYFYQETGIGLSNTVNINNLSKKNYYLMLGLGYKFNIID